MKIFPLKSLNSDNVKDGSCCKKCCLACYIVSTTLISAIVALIVCKITVSSNVKKTIEKDPKFIISSIEKMYQKERKDAQEKALKKAPEMAEKIAKGDNPFFGNPNGSKVVIEFFDYACGHCKRQATELYKLVSTDSDVKVILVDLPIMSANSLTAAQVGVYIGINNPAKLDRFYTEMSKHNVDIASIKAVLKMIGLPESYVNSAKNDKKVAKILEANYNDARDIGLQGTPALLVNGKFVGGAVSADDLKAMLK